MSGALTWAALPDFILPNHLRVASNASQLTNTAPYTASEKPDDKYALSRKLADSTLIPRVLGDLRNGLEKMQQNRTLPDEGIFNEVMRCIGESRDRNQLQTEESVKRFMSTFLDIVFDIVAKIYKAQGKIFCPQNADPMERWSQRGDWNVFDRSNKLSVAFEWKSYSVAVAKARSWKGCWKLNHLCQQEGVQAIGMKLGLQMASSSLDSAMGNRLTRFSALVGGNIAFVAELVPYQERFEGTTLLTSDFFGIANDPLPHYNPQDTTEPQEASEIPDSRPLLGLLVAMLCTPLDGFEITEPAEDVLNQESIFQLPNKTDGNVGEQYNSGSSEYFPLNDDNFRFSYNARLLVAYHHPALSSVPETLYRHFPISNLPASTDVKTATCIRLIFSNLLGSGKDGRVWQGTSSHIPSPIVVKSFRTKEAALKEAEFYENAPSTLSKLMPKYFGLYARRDQSWFVIIMEDLGESLEKQISLSWIEVKKRLGPDTWYDMISEQSLNGSLRSVDLAFGNQFKSFIKQGLTMGT